MSNEPMGQGDARRYAWPPFESGNQVARIHGAYSEVAIAQRASAVHEALLDVAPYLADARYAPSVHRYLTATAREQLAHEALMNSSKLSPRLLEAATAAARLAWSMGAELGLTPAGHARLKVLAAGAEQATATIADLVAEGRSAWARRGVVDEHPSDTEIGAQRPAETGTQKLPAGRPEVSGEAL